MKRSISKVIFLAAVLTLTGAQCISFNGGSGAAGAGGGVFKSVNRGDQWQHKVAVPTADGVKNFGGANVTALAVDPQDHLALYVGTRENGMFYSYDGGDSWTQAKGVSGSVAAVAVDPKNKCIIYLAAGNRILKSYDCNRTFEPMYNDATPMASISVITISPFDARTLYVGTTKGAILKSVDGGMTWSIQANVRNKVVDLIVDPHTPSTVYAAIDGRGVWKSIDEGKNFSDMSNSLQQINGGKDVRRLAIDRAASNTLILASKHKVSRSVDGGLTWTALPIVTPETVEIFAFGINPKDSKEIYYGTATTFYRSSDGGARWSANKLPTTRQASALLVDPENPSIIYMGALEVKN